MSSTRHDFDGRRDGSKSIATACSRGQGYDGNTREFPTYKKLVIATLSTTGRMKYMLAPRTNQIAIVTSKINSSVSSSSTPSPNTPTPKTSAKDTKATSRRSLGPEIASYDSLAQPDDKLTTALEELDNVLYGISMFLINTLDQSLKKQFSIACDLNDPFALWEALEERFDPRSTTDYTSTMQDLLTIKLQPNESIHELNIRMTTLSSALLHINAAPPDPMMVHLLKQALPAPYKQCIAHMSHQSSDGTTFTFNSATKMLVDEEARLKLELATTHTFDNTATAHAAVSTHSSHKGKKSHGGPTRNTRACYRCADPNHRADMCPIAPKDLKCTLCDKTGHNAKACINKGDGSHTAHSAIALTCVTTRLGESASALVSTSSNHNSSEWIVDSGASRHMTPHLHNLTNIRTIPAVTIYSAASGATVLKAVQCGTASIRTPHGTLVIHDVLHHPTLAFNLISVGQLCRADHTICFEPGSFTISKNDASLHITTPVSNGSYTIINDR